MASDKPLAITYDVNWLELWTRRFGDPLLDAETFRITKQGCLSEIGNKPSSLGEIQGQYMGLLRFTPKGWAEVKRIRLSLPYTVRDKMHMTGTLQKIIESKNIEIEAIRYDGDWGEADSTDYLAVYRRD